MEQTKPALPRRVRTQKDFFGYDDFEESPWNIPAEAGDMASLSPREIRERNRYFLKILVRTRDNYQRMRTATDNRLGMKKDGTPQNVADRPLDDTQWAMLTAVGNELERQELAVTKKIGEEVLAFPIYTDYLAHVYGVERTTAAYLISMIDIYEADTVSKIWQYAGLNPGMVRGKKSVEKDAYRPTMGPLVKEYTTPNGKEHVIYLTDTMVRGDKRSDGFVAPFNGRLRSLLLGGMTVAFMRKDSPYRQTYYDPYRHRLDNHDVWKERSKGHRHRAALRYMMKMFLKDLYTSWRRMEGLPVTESYQVAYLGHVHGEHGGTGDDPVSQVP